jgi:predicted S18 family serine protease
MNIETKEFLKDYNNLLEEINNEIDGVEDMPKNKKAKKISDVNIIDLEQSKFLYNWYLEIKNKTKCKQN